MADLTADGSTTHMLFPALWIVSIYIPPEGVCLHSRIPLRLWNAARHIFHFSRPKACSRSCMLGPAEAWANRTFKLRDWGSWDGELPFSSLRCHDHSIDSFEV